MSAPAAPAAVWPPQTPTVINAALAAQTFAAVEDVAAWFLRQAFGRKLECLEQDVFYGDQPDPDLVVEFPAVAVFARKARGGQDEWLGWACGPQITGARHFETVLQKVRSAGGLAA